MNHMDKQIGEMLSRIASGEKQIVQQAVTLQEVEFAKEQVMKFRRQAGRQLACMSMLAGTRAGERKGIALMQGKLA